MKSKNKFHILFSENYFDKNEIITNGTQKLKVISTPKTTWWKIILKIISFNLYKPSIYYKVKTLK